MATHTNAGKSTQFRPIGVIRSALKARGKAPQQGREGAPDAWLGAATIRGGGSRGTRAGDEIMVLTRLHRARREALRVYPARTGAGRSPAYSRRARPTGQTQ